MMSANTNSTASLADIARASIHVDNANSSDASGALNMTVWRIRILKCGWSLDAGTLAILRIFLL